MFSRWEGRLDGSTGVRAVEPEEAGLELARRDALIGVSILESEPPVARPPSFPRFDLVLFTVTVCARAGLVL